jgi:hypothetical protein
LTKKEEREKVSEKSKYTALQNTLHMTITAVCACILNRTNGGG